MGIDPPDPDRRSGSPTVTPGLTGSRYAIADSRLPVTRSLYSALDLVIVTSCF